MHRSNTLAVKQKSKRTEVAYARIAGDLRKQIRTGALAPGRMIPSLRRMSQQYDVAVGTVQQAVKELIAEGLLHTEDGRGTFVLGSGAALSDSNTSIDVPPPPLLTRNSVVLGHVGVIYTTDLNEIAQPVPNSNRLGISVTLTSIERAVSQRGGATVGYNRHRSPHNNRLSWCEAIDELLKENVDSIICIVKGYTCDADAAYLNGAFGRVPTVLVVYDEIPRPVSYSYFTSHDAGRTAAEHLIAQGCRKLLVFCPSDQPWARHRLEGIQQAASLAGLPSGTLDVRVNTSPCETPPTEVIYAYARTVLQDGMIWDGVIGINDEAALRYMQTVELSTGQRPGIDYALIGFDDTDTARDNGITSMRPPGEALGEGAVNLLEQILRRRAVSSIVEPMRICLHPELVQRISTSMPNRRSRIENTAERG